MRIIDDLSKVNNETIIFRVLFANGNRKGSIDFKIFERVCELKNGREDMAILFHGTKEIVRMMKSNYKISSTGKNVVDLISLLEQMNLSKRERGYIIISDIEHKDEIINSLVNCTVIDNKVYKCESRIKHKPVYVAFLGEESCIEEELLKCSGIDLPKGVRNCEDLKRMFKIDLDKLKIENCFEQLFTLIEILEKQ